MSAINKLLPIAPSGATHTSPSGQGAGQRLATNVSANGIAASGAPTAVQERTQQSPDKSFAQTYEDRLKAQTDASDADRASSRPAHQVRETEDRSLPPNVIDSGNGLPLEGESLPLTERRTSEELPGDLSQENLALVEPVVVSVKEAGDLLASSPLDSESVSLSVESVSDPVVSTISSHVPENSLGTMQGLTPDALVLGMEPVALTGQTEPNVADLQQPPEPVDKFATLTVAVSGGQNATRPELNAAPVQQVAVASVSARVTLPSEQSTLLQLETGAEAAEFAWQGDLTDRIKVWRGMAGQESIGTGVSQNRQEMPLNWSASQGSQLQQLAQSIRVTANQMESPSVGMGAGERQSNSTHVMTSTESFSAWRADNLQPPSTNSAARSALGGMSFTQTMQASNFGMPLGSSFNQNSWAESVSQRVTLMAGQRISSASIALDPPELGAMTVKVSVDGDQASVSFLSAHAQVREALELTFPRLQDLLSQQGLQLVDAQVSDDPAARQQAREGGSTQEAQRMESAEDDARVQSHVTAAVGLIDYYV